MNMPDTILAAMLAHRFGRDMVACRQPWQMREIRRRNATPDYVAACATHDFCDANDIMHGAFCAVVGHDPIDFDLDEEEMSQRDVDLWNAAWPVAKRIYFTDGGAP